MTDKTIPVDVEWALQGKTLGRAGVRVLACSNGNLSLENFTEVIGRFSIGTPDKLPQVSVSFVTSGDGPGRLYYLAMAIHKWAPDVQTDGGELLEGDDDGRPVAVTTYFCVPYQPLAHAAIPYQAMYQEFDHIRLGTKDGPPLQVEFPVRAGFTTVSALAMQAAGRLLTRRPVCVLGAESATMAERLEFIGTVASLLPYGFRTRLTAATWVRSTQRDHRLRLFFSDAKRDADPPDDVIYWGNPGRTPLTPDDDWAYVYERWLADTVGQLTALARLTAPRSFTREDILESLDQVGLTRSEPDERKSDEPGQPVPVARRPSKAAKLDVDQLLRDCASSVREHRFADLNTAINRLKNQAKSHTTPEERERYRKFIREQALFRHNEALDKLERKLRDALLRVAFTLPLTYPDYCFIEESLGTESPDQALLRLIEDTGMSETDMRIRSVVYGQQLKEKDIARKLQNWYISAQVTAPQLINVMAGRWYRSRHVFYASLITADLMNRMICDPALIRQVLQNHSYLARVLQNAGTDRDHRQVYVLSTFLHTAYPNRLFEKDIRQVLMDNPEPPTPALLVAVLLHLANTGYAQLAREAYFLRTAQAMNLQPEIQDVLWPLLTDGWPSGLAASHPHADQA